MSVLQDAVQAVMKKAIALAPDGWIPGGHPDPLMHHKHGLIRIDPQPCRARGGYGRGRGADAA
jgi:hypothetical protein